MIKNLSFIIALILLNGCVESVALLGPVTTGAGSQKIAQSAISSSLSYGIKKQTGMSPSEHALSYVKKHNPQNQKDNCIKPLDITSSEACAAIKKNVSETKKKLIDIKKSIINKSNIEDLARKSDLLRKR